MEHIIRIAQEIKEPIQKETVRDLLPAPNSIKYRIEQDFEKYNENEKKNI